VTNEPEWYRKPDGRHGAGPQLRSSDQELRSILYDSGGTNELTVFASFLFTNNAGVSLMAFALGFAFGIPTAMLLVYNLTMLGALMALYASRGMAVELAGWLSIHGTTELFAILLAGAAGFHIGWSVVFPGEDSRLAAATRSGKTAADGDDRRHPDADGGRLPRRLRPPARAERPRPLRRRRHHADPVAALFLPAAGPADG
jgi:hypothetical protein